MSKKYRASKQRPSITIRAAVNRLRDAAETMNASRSRYAANDFLVEVYSIYCEWLERGLAKRHIRQLDCKTRSHQPKTQQPFKTLIIAANCSLEAKLRSRWIRALEYALCTNTDPEELLELLRHNGGIAGCAKLSAKKEPKRGPPRDDWGFD
jgi:hypothetical protein